MFLFYFNINFLAILYLAVYIGAVAVFFLFVVMMTDLNSDEFREKTLSLNFFILSIFALPACIAALLCLKKNMYLPL